MSIIGDFPRVIIAGTSSGCGKSTVVAGLIAAYKSRGTNIKAAKCGPDYLDTLMHSKLGVSSINLDTYLCGDEVTKQLMHRYCSSCEISIIEGVMGLYDGLANASHSTNYLSVITSTPVILIIDPKGMGQSVSALLHGYLKYKYNNIKGIIFNNIKDANYLYYKSLIESDFDITVCGYIPTNDDFRLIEGRYGLETMSMGSNFFNYMAEVCLSTLDMDKILMIAKSAPPFIYDPLNIDDKRYMIDIGVAKDTLFNRNYLADLDLLEKLGVNLHFFSPLSDRSLPENISGIILSGGCLKDHAEELSANINIRKQVSELINSGVPTIAMNAGYEYLCYAYQIGAGFLPMCNLINSTVYESQKLKRFGYSSMVSETNNIISKKFQEVKTHEYHYSDTDNNGDSFLITKPNGKSWRAGYAGDRIYAGYNHFYLWGNLSSTLSFLDKCTEFNNEFR